ncbi:MAG: ABC transporter permease subunit [Candidatus Edwardsbacteria bacterium]
MFRIKAIALNTFKEAVRDRVLYGLLIFGLLLIVGSKILTPLTLGEQSKIIRDIGLAGISIFGFLVIVVVGTTLVYKELDKRTIYTIISKPIHRWEFIAGKYLGLLLTLLVIVLIMTLFFYGVVFWVDRAPELTLLEAILLIYFELMVMTAVALLFSAMSSPALSAILTFVIYFVGHLSADLKVFAEKIPSELIKILCYLFYYILPNLENFNIKSKIVHQIPVSFEYILSAIAYGIIYAVAVLLLTSIIFQKKSFK